MLIHSRLVQYESVGFFIPIFIHSQSRKTDWLCIKMGFSLLSEMEFFAVPKNGISLNEYYGAAEPPVRCGESHLSGLTEPPHFIY